MTASRSIQNRPHRFSGGSVTSVLAGAAILLALVIAGVWYYSARNDSGEPPVRDREQHAKLSENTRAILERIDIGHPVEIRFYAILDTNTLPASLQAFAARVGRLIAEYERQAQGKVKVVQLTPETAAAMARDDGIRPFNLDRGDPSFLGIALQQRERRESLPRLLPEWESALEADLSRAIARLSDTRPPPANSPASIDPDVIAAVRRAIPDLAGISQAQAGNRLREQAQAEFRRSGTEWAGKIAEAQQRATEAQSRSEADQQAALSHLVELQSQRAAELSEIASRFEKQMEALDHLKSDSR